MRDEPLVALVYSVPLIVEALEGVCDGVGELRSFRSQDGEVRSLLEWLDPDAVVVDSVENARVAAEYASDRGTPVVHIDFDRGAVRALLDGEWVETDHEGSAEDVRNLLAAGIHGRGSRV